MSLLKKLSSALAVWLVFGTALMATASSSSETALGISSFTVYNEGMIREYYNSDSKVSAISYINPNGYQYATQVITYDEYGTPAEKVFSENYGFWGRHSTFRYKYNMLNLVLEETQSSGFFGQRTLKYHYDLFNNVDNVRAYAGFFFPSANERVSLAYTAEGRLQARSYYHSDGSLALHHEWDYDFLGRVIIKRVYNSSLQLVSTTTTDYDVAEGVNLETNYDASGAVLSLAYNYRDTHGRVYERQLRDAFGELITVCVYEYSWSGQLAKVTDKDASARILGSITTSFDGLDRPYLHTFKFIDNGLAVERLKPYLQLPGNDL